MLSSGTAGGKSYEQPVILQAKDGSDIDPGGGWVTGKTGDNVDTGPGHYFGKTYRQLTFNWQRKLLEYFIPSPKDL